MIRIAALIFALLTARAAELPLKIYSIDDGLAYTQVQCVYPDSHGFVWFCTGDGMSRFDGAHFTNIRMAQGLPYPIVNGMMEYPAGVYWFGTNGGLARYDANAPSRPIKTFHMGNEVASDRVNAIYRDRKGVIWLGTDGGLFTMNDSSERGEIKPYPLNLPGRSESVVQIWAFAEGDEGGLWMGTKYGAVRILPDGRLVQYPVVASAATDHVNAITVGRGGEVWIAHELGIFVLRPQPAAQVRAGARVSVDYALRSALASGSTFRAGSTASLAFAPPSTPGQAQYARIVGRDAQPHVLGLYRFADGRIWITCLAGLFEAVAGKLHAIEYNRPVMRDLGGPMAEDRDGNVWLATMSSGAVKLSMHGFVGYGESDGLSWVNTTFEDPQGRIVSATGNMQVGVYNDERFTVFPLLRPQIANATWQSPQCLLVDHLGEWWAATTIGLVRFARVARTEDLARARPKVVYTVRDGLPDTRVIRIMEDSRGDIWTAGWTLPHNSIARWNRATDTFTRFTEADGLPPLVQASMLFEDRSGDVWIAFREGGLARFRSGRFQFFGAAQGIPEGVIPSCFVDSVDRIWCLNVQKGLLRIDRHHGDTLKPAVYTARDGLAESFIGSIGEDATGRIYMNSSEGVDTLDPAANRVRRFASAESMPSGRAFSIFRDHTGALWFSTRAGVSRVTPQAHPSVPPPPAFVGSVRINGIEMPVPPLGTRTLAEGDLPAARDAVQIDYFSVTFSLDPPFFQYKLEGADDDWSRPTTLRTVNYERLPPGHYRFLVRTIGGEGLPPSSPATLSFRILPPVWKRWWALALMIAMAVGATVAFERYRERRVTELRRSREERIAELERVRQAIAADLHDDIGSTLTQIAVFSEVVQRRLAPADPGVAEPLAYISRASSELIDSMSDIVWAINPQRDHLKDLVHRMRRFAADTLTARGIQFKLLLPGDEQDIRLEGNLRRQVFLIFKEAVNNLVRHSGCTEAEVAMKVGGSRLLLRVADNGTGFETPVQADGHGLTGMQTRAAVMGGGFEIKSSKEGTVVSLEVPYQNS